MNWAQETFAYADAHDGERWLGVHTAQHVAVTAGGLLVEPDFAQAAAGTEVSEPGGIGDDAGDGGEGSTGEGGPGTSPPPAGTPVSAPPSVTQFYAQFDLDSVRGIKQLSQILENVSARLGPNTELSLEVRANNPDGYDDATQRIVAENATNLGASAAEFE